MAVNPIEKRFEKVTKYHYLFFTLYFCCCRFPSIWHLVNFIFLSPPMSYTCGTGVATVRRTGEANLTSVDSDTASYSDKKALRLGSRDVCPCDDPQWDLSVFTKTVQTKYGIYCEKKWLISFSETMSVFGLLVSSYFFGYLSDTYGRLLVLCVSSFGLACAGCLVTVMPDIYSFICMRFIEGFGTGGVIVSGYVLCIEYCGLKYRETISAILHIPINIGHMLIAGVSYVFRDCDYFQIAISIPMFLPVLFWFILQESPKWLLDSHHRERAVISMEKICRFNNGQNCETIRAEIEAFQSSAKSDETFKFWHIVKHRTLFKIFLCMSYLFFTSGIGYYGVTQFIGKMSGNVHLNTLIGGSFLVPGSLLSIVLLNKLGRKPFIIFTTVLSGSCILIVVCIPSTFEPAWLRILFAGLSNSGFYMLFIVIFLYCVELFPTSARNSALGVLSLVSRIGQMSGPQINRLSHTIAGIIFGVLALFSVLVVLPLPETKGVQLPSSIEDVPIDNKNLQIKPAESSK